MGISTNAILAWGIPIEDGDEPPGNLTDEQWEEAQDAWRDEAREQGFQVVVHCSDEYPMYFLAAYGSEITARRGEPVDLRTTGFPSVDYRESFDAAMRQIGLDPSEAGWHLMSYWG